MIIYCVELCSQSKHWGGRGYRQKFICLAESYEIGLQEGIKFAKQLYPDIDWGENIVNTINGEDMWINVKKYDIAE